MNLKDNLIDFRLICKNKVVLVLIFLIILYLTIDEIISFINIINQIKIINDVKFSYINDEINLVSNKLYNYYPKTFLVSIIHKLGLFLPFVFGLISLVIFCFDYEYKTISVRLVHDNNFISYNLRKFVSIILFSCVVYILLLIFLSALKYLLWNYLCTTHSAYTNMVNIRSIQNSLQILLITPVGLLLFISYSLFISHFFRQIIISVIVYMTLIVYKIIPLYNYINLLENVTINDYFVFNFYGLNKIQDINNSVVLILIILLLILLFHLLNFIVNDKLNKS